MLSEYELLRQQNIADNQRILAALGLDTVPKEKIHAARAPQQRIIWSTNQARRATLRERAEGLAQVPDDDRPRRPCFKEAARRLRTKGNIPVPSTSSPRAAPRRRAKPRAPGGGQRGGWNAGPYVGTALVTDGSEARRVAIRQRPDGRLYGYVGRTQICFRESMTFPCMISGVKVVAYTNGGSLDEFEDGSSAGGSCGGGVVVLVAVDASEVGEDGGA